MFARRLSVLRSAPLVGVCFLTLFGMTSTPAEAKVYFPTSLDATLLESDAVVFATVAEMVAVEGVREEGETLTWVRLVDLEVVSSRWPLDQGSLTVWFSGSPAADGGLATLPHQPHLVTMARYLLLLRGGGESSAPLIRSSASVYRVQGQHVICPGGLVFGLTPRGLDCSTRAQQLGPPLTEAELVASLRGAVAEARIRRPTFAAQQDAAQRANTLPHPQLPAVPLTAATGILSEPVPPELARYRIDPPPDARHLGDGASDEDAATSSPAPQEEP